MLQGSQEVHVVQVSLDRRVYIQSVEELFFGLFWRSNGKAAVEQQPAPLLVRKLPPKDVCWVELGLAVHQGRQEQTGRDLHPPHLRSDGCVRLWTDQCQFLATTAIPVCSTVGTGWAP
jgi:hypothetical protein